MTWVAVDCGGSRLRAWVHEGERVTLLSSDAGAGAQVEGALLAMLEPHLTPDTATTVICCGVTAAGQGWDKAAYVPVPAAPPDATRALRVADTDPRLALHLLPPMSQAAPADVMHAEHTRIAGFIAAHPDWDGVLCLTGAHSKWVHISAGEIVSFATFMTGEMFALLSRQSVLRPSIGEGWDAAAFSDAVSDAISRPERVAAALFALRAGTLLEGLSPATARARLSGMLIGVELAAARPYWLGRDVAVIGEGVLAQHYATALLAQGVRAPCHDADDLTLSGLRAAYAATKGS